MKGSIRKRGETYTYTIDLGKDPATGKRIQKSKGGFLRKGDAQAALAEIQTQYNQGLYINESEMTFEDFRKKWIKIYKATTSAKISTVRVREYESSILCGVFGKGKLRTITGEMYQDVLIELSKKYQANTLAGINATGKMIFRKAVELRHIRANPTEYAVLPRKKQTVEEIESENKLPKFFEKGELAEFLDASKRYDNPQAYIIFLTLAYTGMRVGELCALKWRDIDFEESTIKINRTYYNPTNKADKYVLLPPKTPTSVRTVYVSGDLLAELKSHKLRQGEMRLRIGSWHGDFVITKVLKYSGYPETPKQIGVMMKRITKRDGLKELTPHGLRHTHASLLAEAGVGLDEIMERLGHKDDDTTRGIYLHVTQNAKKEAPQKFAELMRNVSKM